MWATFGYAKLDEDKITRRYAEKHGEYLGYMFMRKQGFGPELWKIDVYDVYGTLYGGDIIEDPKYLEMMNQEAREEILNNVKTTD